MAGVDILASAFNGANAAFLGEQYARWAANPASVDPSFAELFGAMNDEARAVLEEATGASWAPHYAELPGPEAVRRTTPGRPRAPAALSTEQIRAATIASLRALMLIRSYRVRGHLEARLDPLGLTIPPPHPELDPRSYGFTDADLDKPIFIDNVLGRETATLREIMQILRDTYCGPIGVEFMHIQDPDQKSWIQRKVEGAPWHTAFDVTGEAHASCSSLPRPRASRCSARSATSPPSASDWKAAKSPSPRCTRSSRPWPRQGVNEIAIGMPHRGRLNTLVNIVKKPLTAVFSEFGGESFKPDDVQGSGDVKYHLGTSTDVEIAGRSVHLSLQPNPSHLEAVDPVVVGKVRARQDTAGDTQRRSSVMAILMHGDAAFAGQGLVYETLAMSQLIGYRTGGTVHVIVNNQIGFTTVPAHAYSGLYCTDVAKSIQAPILHVNGDDPEAVMFCARMAAEFRMRFATDIVLDIVCYRRHGHNETDEPAFTQPVMYRAISQQEDHAHAVCRAPGGGGRGARGGSAGDVGRVPADAGSGQRRPRRPTSRTRRTGWRATGPGSIAGGPEFEREEHATAVAETTLKQIGIGAVPRAGRVRGASTHRPPARGQAGDAGVRRGHRLGDRRGAGVRLAAAGRPPRAPVRRGLPARHVQPAPCGADRPDQPERIRAAEQHRARPGEDRDLQLAAVGSRRAGLRIRLLAGRSAHAGAVGGAVRRLRQRRAGDHRPVPRVSGETKWLRMSGLTLLLPHGYEGQGPEHSSARIERYLQLCAERNMSGVQPDHAGQLLPRAAPAVEAQLPQAAGGVHAEVAAAAQAGGLVAGRYERTAAVPLRDPGDRRHRAAREVRRVVLCTGKVYYDLLAERREQRIKDVAIMRLEQLYPFPEKHAATACWRRTATPTWCGARRSRRTWAPGTSSIGGIEKVLGRLDMPGEAAGLCRPRRGGQPGDRLRRARMRAEQAALVAAALGIG